MAVRVGKRFTFDAAHQLIGHTGKCANVHGHTYTLEVVLEGDPMGASQPSDEGFVMDFGILKRIVNEQVVDFFDHAFLAKGNEPILDALYASGSKVAIIGVRTTAENLVLFIGHKLKQAGLPIYSVTLWETQTAFAQVLGADVPDEGPTYQTGGGCDVE